MNRLHTPRRVVLTVAATLASALLLGACGGDETAAVGVADPATLVVALDIDRYTSLEDIASAAARERGAPGEQERVLVLLHSQRADAAMRAAERLRSQGLAVRAIERGDTVALRHVRP